MTPHEALDTLTRLVSLSHADDYAALTAALDCLRGATPAPKVKRAKGDTLEGMLAPCRLEDFSQLSRADLLWAWERHQAGDAIGTKVIKGSRKAKMTRKAERATATPSYLAWAAAWLADNLRPATGVEGV